METFCQLRRERDRTRRNKQVNIRFSEEEYKILADAADRNDMFISTFIATKALEAAARTLK